MGCDNITIPAGQGDVRRASITGIGSYVPEKVLTNKDLEKIVDTTDEWIVTRTGIRERHIAAEGETTASMGAMAAERALENAGVSAEEVDMIICATITPEMLFPNTACFIQERIGAKNAFCFGLEAACSGFVYGLEVARQFVSSGAKNTVLVIGAEKLSAFVDWNDRATCILFGDGAGAAVVQATGARVGIAHTVLGSDGGLTDLLKVPGGGSLNPPTHETIDEGLHYLSMNGREVFKHAVRAMADSARTVLSDCGVSIEDVDWLVPHQANQRIVEAIGQRLEIAPEKVFMNLQKYGNMSAASIPVALDEACREGHIQKGDLVLLIAFGGGFTWGASVVEW